jgi:hypothetical protein
VLTRWHVCLVCCVGIQATGCRVACHCSRSSCFQGCHCDVCVAAVSKAVCTCPRWLSVSMEAVNAGKPKSLVALNFVRMIFVAADPRLVSKVDRKPLSVFAQMRVLLRSWTPSRALLLMLVMHG